MIAVGQNLQYYYSTELLYLPSKYRHDTTNILYVACTVSILTFVILILNNFSIDTIPKMY